MVEVLGAAEADVGTPLGRAGPTTIGASQVLGHIGPGAAAQHAIHPGWRACRILVGGRVVIVLIIPIGHPLPDVASHVVKPESAAAHLATSWGPSTEPKW